MAMRNPYTRISFTARPARPMEQVRLEETRRGALCSVQGSGGGCSLRDRTRDGRLPTVGLQSLRQDLCHRQR